MTQSYDVFLSHNSKDKPTVRALAEALRSRGLKVWLDEWELVPGRPWQEALEEIIETTRSSAVLVGKDGLGPWQDAEMRGCLSEFVDRKLPVIPVLMPGAPEVPRLPFFLKRFTWVDLRGGLTEEGIDRLQWGATGERPDRSKLPSITTEAPESAMPVREAQPGSAEVRSASPEVEAPVAVAREQRDQKARALWGVPAWIGLLTLLGFVVFALSHYFPSPGKPEANNQEMGAPGTGNLSSSTAASAPVPAATQTKPAVTASETCVSGKEREETGIVFVRICPGTFTMGSANNDWRADDDEKPARQVTLSEFWIGKTEITNEQYRLFRSDHQGDARLPAIQVSWFDAKAACEHFGGRLPTEAQWEYAARAGSQTAWSFGDNVNMLGEYAWDYENSDTRPRPVGTKKPNAWGLYDMYGNVWEWVADWYGTYPSIAQTDPPGPSTGEARVLRGHSYLYRAIYLRSAVRGASEPEIRSRSAGFRCILFPPVPAL